jgi:4-hydroxy-tetrahydrodipicolinate synthase
MSTMAEWKGLFVAVTTPFRDGVFARETFVRHMEHLLANGVQGLVPCGTTGESATLSREEKREVIAAAVEVAAGRVPVIAGVGTNSTRTTLQFAADAVGAGADGLLVVTPYYNKPPQASLYEHYRLIAEEIGAPIVVYNVPSRTGVSIRPETLARLAELPAIVAVKDATADMRELATILRLCGTRLRVFSGDDFSALGHAAVGGVGAISVTGNVDPRRASEMYARFFAGDVAGAQRLNLELLPLNDALFAVTNPIPVKYAVSRLGFGTADVRLPLTPLDAAGEARVEAAMRALGLLDEER